MLRISVTTNSIMNRLDWEVMIWFTRSFWPTWFGMDNVYPSPDHVPFLHRHFEPLRFDEEKAKVPYIPFARMP